MIDPVPYHEVHNVIPPFSISDINEDCPSTFGDDDALLSMYSKSMAGVSCTNSLSETEASSEFFTDAQSIASSMKTSELRKPKANRAIALHYDQESSDSGNLDLNSVGLIGRETEVSTLRYCLANLLASHSSSSDSETSKPSGSFKELIFVKGPSGVGKSSVVRTIEEDLKQEQRSDSNYNGIFIDGKFEMNTMDSPYLGISKAFDKILRQIKKTKKDSIGEVQHALRDGLGKEVRLLMHLLPELKDLMNDDQSNSSKSTFDMDAFENGMDQMRFAFRVLARVLGSIFSPLVLFLDDLQWADVSSLQVLDYLISDTQNPNALMIIGCYRSEEVNENSLLFSKAIALREKANKYRFHFTEMEIKAFDVAAVEKVIATSLTPETPEKGLKLAMICVKKTLGNPFFVFEFLKMLHHEGLVSYNSSSKRWTWDMVQIEDATMSTANVVVLLQNRMKKLSNEVQVLLQCAAYFGSSFYEPTLDMVWQHHGRRLIGAKTNPVSKLLPGIVQGDFLEPYGDKHFRWVHDKVQEAALCLTGRHRESFQLDIGSTLYYCLDTKHLEDDLFNVVDLINRGNVHKRPEFALANMRAAKKARSISAFESGAKYAAHGIELLDKNSMWTENRQLTLELYSIGAELNLLAGNISAADEYCDAVLSRKELSTMETLSLKMVRAKALSTMELKFDEALEYCLKLLKEIGCKLTWSRGLVPVQAVSKMLKTIRKLEKTPKAFFETTAPIKDATHKATASLLSRIFYICYHSNNIALAFVALCKLVDITLEHGINEYSAKSIVSIGTGLIILKNEPEKTQDFIKIGLSLIAKFGRMRSGETIYLAYAHGLAWYQKLESCHEPLLDGYKRALRAGETEYSCWNLLSYVVMMPYALGKPLNHILVDSPKAMIQFEEAASAAHILATRVMTQMITNLSDPSCPNPSELEGEIFSKANDTEKEAKVHLAISHFAESELLLFRGDYVTAANRAIKLGEAHTKLAPGIYTVMTEVCHRAVVLYAAALKTKKKRYKVHAKKVHKKVTSWAKAGNPNVQYFDVFFAAEQLALEKKFDEAKGKYKSAIKMATEARHLHHAGLLNERYADFLLDCCSNVQESKRALKIASKWYSDWGAIGKVRDLELKLSELNKDLFWERLESSSLDSK